MTIQKLLIKERQQITFNTSFRLPEVYFQVFQDYNHATGVDRNLPLPQRCTNYIFCAVLCFMGGVSWLLTAQRHGGSACDALQTLCYKQSYYTTFIQNKMNMALISWGMCRYSTVLVLHPLDIYNCTNLKALLLRGHKKILGTCQEESLTLDIIKITVI